MLKERAGNDAEAVQRLLAAIIKVAESTRAEEVAASLLGLIVLDLGPTFAWVTAELLEFYLTARILSPVIGMTFTLTRRLELPAAVRPFRFSSKPGETAEEMKARFDKEAASVSGKGKSGRQPRSEERFKQLALYGYWFYRLHVRKNKLKDTIHAIAREYSMQRGVGRSDDRQTVKYGLKQAERLLSLHEFRVRAKREFKPSRRQQSFLQTFRNLRQTITSAPDPGGN